MEFQCSGSSVPAQVSPVAHVSRGVWAPAIFIFLILARNTFQLSDNDVSYYCRTYRQWFVSKHYFQCLDCFGSCKHSIGILLAFNDAQ